MTTTTLKRLQQMLFLALIPLLVTQAALAEGRPSNGSCVYLSDHMKKTQGILATQGIDLRGFGWRGRTWFYVFVTPVSYSGTTVNVRIDRIIRMWRDFDLRYDAVRQTDCQRFPCIDEKGNSFPATRPLNGSVGIGDIVNVDKDQLSLYKRSVELDNNEKQRGYCTFWNDKGWSL